MRCVDLTGRGVLHAAIVGEATADVEDSTRDAIVRRLLQAGADVHCADEDGKNMCHLLDRVFSYTYIVISYTPSAFVTRLSALATAVAAVKSVAAHY